MITRTGDIVSVSGDVQTRRLALLLVQNGRAIRVDLQRCEWERIVRMANVEAEFWAPRPDRWYTRLWRWWQGGVVLDGQLVAKSETGDRK